MLADAYQLGRRNQEILDLARAWCHHVRRDQSWTGVGMIEEETGLPVSGGSLTCDHARGQSPAGAQLAGIALDFYQRNCVGCTKRVATGAIPNLGTWAEQLLAQQRAAEECAAEERAVRDAEREARHRQRRLRLAGTDPVTQSILDVIDRIDAESPETEACEELLALARLHPAALGPEVVADLVELAVSQHNETCLEAVSIARNGTGTGSADILQTALRALREGWGRRTSASIMVSFATAADIDAELVRAVVRIASSPLRHWPGRAPGSRPEALLRCIELAPERCLDFLTQELNNENDWRRGAAAQAMTCIIQHGTAPTGRMLAMLLSALRYRDDRRMYDAQASVAVEQAIANVILRETALAEEVFSERWDRASAAERAHVIGSYDRLVRSHLDSTLPTAAATAAASRSIQVMLDRTTEPELLMAAAEVAKLVLDYHASTVEVTVEALLGALAVVCRLLEEMSEPAPPLLQQTAQQAFASTLEREQRRNALSVCKRSLVSGVTAAAVEQPQAFWTSFAAVWATDPEIASTRRELTAILGGVAKEQGSLATALPYLYSALVGADQAVRAAAVSAFSALLEEDGVRDQLPELVTEGIVNALTDKYLIVVAAACDAIGLVDVPADKRVDVMNQLLAIAATYASQRYTADRMVSDALEGVRRLARGTPVESRVDASVLRIIDSMGSYEAVQQLSRMRSLATEPAWVASVVKALRPDSDPQLRRLRDDDKERLLRLLGEQPPERVAPHVQELVSIALSHLPQRAYKAWQVGDVLASLGYFAEAKQIAEKVVELTPDVLAARPYRLRAQQILACFDTEAAAAAGNETTLADALARWESIGQEIARDDEENEHARRPFIPPYLPE
ncbi:MAG TPA: hypothetical protein VMJ10_14105 [Kofleriaceae bacterium]|nr:hypothetical protein [Kofleriaceae bacterium]